jgi:hypothetical protein
MTTPNSSLYPFLSLGLSLYPFMQTTSQSLGDLLKSARDIMRKDKGLNGDLDCLPCLRSAAVPGGGFGRRLAASPNALPRPPRTHRARTPRSPAGGTPALLYHATH